MKDRVDKSRGLVTLMTESLGKIKHTETLCLAKHATRRKRKRHIPAVRRTVLRSKHQPHDDHARKTNTQSHRTRGPFF